MTVAAIILAAGASRRLGQPKQLVGFDGEALLQRALRIAKESGASPVLAVLGAHFASICVNIPFDQAIPVLNDHWEQGMSTSIHAGLHELDVRSPEAAGAIIMTCDQPRLTPAHLQGLLDAFHKNAGSHIVASAYAGSLGIPAIFPRSVFFALYGLRGDKGARALLLQPPCPVVSLPFEGGEVDIDLPSDLAKLK